MGKRVAVIGAGPGGLTAAMLLAHNGYQVDVYERKDKVGGRNGRIELGDFRFDIGPTFLMLPKVLEDVFTFAGRNIGDYLDIKRIEPFYRLRFRGETDFFPTSDRDSMIGQIKELFPGDEEGYDRFMSKEKVKFDRLFQCLKLPYHSPLHFFRPTFLKAINKFDVPQKLYGKLSSYFKYDDLRIAMTFQSKYLGMSPWQCPAAYTILSFIEHDGGIYHPIGGLYRISEAMAKIVEEEGGRIHLNTAVKELVVENGKARGVILENGDKVDADYVVVNADFAHAMTSIVKPGNRRKYTDEDLARRDYSCSTFMLYLGLDKKYDINHHNIIFADDYRKNVREISELHVLSEDPSLYIQNPSITDPTMAPEGKSALYVLVPVTNNTGSIDWEAEKKGFRDLVIRKIKERTELKDIEEHIEVEKIITPLDWEQEYGVYKGATFNLSHKLTQMLYFRPHNKFEEFGNCYLAGGGTHPGSGLPTIYESGRISANLILWDGGKGLAFRYTDVFEQQRSNGGSKGISI